MMPTETVTPRHAIPAYPVRHSGSVLILGYGFTLHDDYARARKLRPDADVIAVNKAAGEYKADHLFSPHWAEPEFLPTWVAMQRDEFGAGFLVHSTPGRNHETGNLNPVPQIKPPQDALSRRDLRNAELIDHWWPGAITNLALADGTGGWMAVRMARFMGYEERILCGVPMERGGHADGDMDVEIERENWLAPHLRSIEQQTSFHEGTFSLSGFTRDLLGQPE